MNILHPIKSIKIAISARRERLRLEKQEIEDNIWCKCDCCESDVKNKFKREHNGLCDTCYPYGCIPGHPCKEWADRVGNSNGSFRIGSVIARNWDDYHGELARRWQWELETRRLCD